MTIAANLNINGEVVAGGGLVVDDQTLKQITRALMAAQANTATAQATANAAQATANTLTLGLTNTNTNLGLLQGTVNGLSGTVNGLPAAFVTSLAAGALGAPLTGAVILAGGATVTASESGQTITLTASPDGPVTAVSLPASYLTGQTFVEVTPTASGQTFTLPAAGSVPNGFAIRIHNGSATTGFHVLPSGTDTFDANGGTTFQINPLGSTAYIGARFTSDGGARWMTEGYN